MNRWVYDLTGQRGEAAFESAATQIINGVALFRPTSLGAKAKDWDFLLEAVDRDNRTVGYCFVQVRATSLPTSGSRLNVRTDRERLGAAAIFPGPTYLVGVDLDDQRCYLVGINETPTAYRSGLTKMNQIDMQNLQLWWKEVTEFWAGIDCRFVSAFKDPEWHHD